VIAKHVSMRSLKRSDFAELLKYLTGEQDKNERVGLVSVTNGQSDRPDVALTEILNTQAQNMRAKSDKTYHLVVSFRAGEQPDGATLKSIEERISAALGYGEHQRVSVVHYDTDNVHIHIAINKIHPIRHTIHSPYCDHVTLGRICETLEREFDLQPDNHQARKRGAENRAEDMERHAGTESLLGWIQRECREQIESARSWAELHQVMRSNGLELRERGNGLVIVAGDGTAVKASSVGRNYSKSSLEARFGAFEPAPDRQAGERPARWYEQKPMRSRADTTELYARYKSEREDAGTSRTAEWARARDRKNRLIEAAKRTGRLKRAAIRLLGIGRLGKKILYAATSKKLVAEIAKINKQYFEERQEIHDKHRRGAWADWLRAQASEGDQEALAALRARHAAQGLTGDTLAGTGASTKPAHRHPWQDSVTKKGTIIYCVGATAVRDDGDNLKISRGADQDGLQVALRIAMERYGQNIRVNGSAAFKEQITRAAAAANLSVTFDDPALERRRQELMQPATKENKHEPSARSEQGRSAGSRAVRSGAAGAGSAGAAQAGRAAASRTGGCAKPDIGRVGRSPPPAGRNRLRSLSELGVVRIASGPEVLLPGHVPGHVEQQGTAANNGVRRDIPGPGRLAAPLAAADKYVFEREQTRARCSDIPKHHRYDGFQGPAVFAGIRKVDGHSLAMLRLGEEVMVLPIDEATARRLKRLAPGTAVSVTSQGSIKKKGRSR
jgi:hypothetical protein